MPESSCTKKETAEIRILVRCKNGDRKSLGYFEKKSPMIP